MENKYKDFSGVVLAGGKSSRMGTPKAFLKIKNKRIIDIALETLKVFFDEVLIVGDDKDRFSKFKNSIVVEDLVKECGPLGGIYTGLKAISNPKAFFVACDMPFLHNGLIKRLLDIAKQDASDCIIPYIDERIEPLHGIYSKAMLTVIEGALKGKDYSVAKLLKRCNCKYIEAEKVESSSFMNMNRPEDLIHLASDENKI